MGKYTISMAMVNSKLWKSGPEGTFSHFFGTRMVSQSLRWQENHGKSVQPMGKNIQIDANLGMSHCRLRLMDDLHEINSMFYRGDRWCQLAYRKNTTHPEVLWNSETTVGGWVRIYSYILFVDTRTSPPLTRPTRMLLGDITLTCCMLNQRNIHTCLCQLLI